MAAFGGIQNLIWIKGCWVKKDATMLIQSLCTDSKSAMSLAKNQTNHKRSKHIDIKYHWLREHTYE